MASGEAKLSAFKENIDEFTCAIVSLAFARSMLPFRGCRHPCGGPLMISIQQFVTPSLVCRLARSVFTAVAAVLFLTAPLQAQTATIRIGHFPNITHVQALVAHALSRANKGWFEERIGPDVKIEWYVYNAGPSAMEAVFAKSIDLTYVGPNPAINAYSRSRGEEVRIVAGAADGGSALVVQGDSTLKTPADF